jgi:hypothetical protein
MDDPAAYLWQRAYLSAVLETDNDLMSTRIYEALAAIEQRLLDPVELHGMEHRAIEDAQTGLLALKAERVGDGSAPEAQPFSRAHGGYSCRTTVRRDLLILILPLYSTNPSFLNLFMNKFTRERVVPIISASVS